MILLLSLFFLQEYYYIDGTEFQLSDGTRILTLSDVSTDLYNYYWYEDGAYISISKSIIKKVDFFSIQELGRKPKTRVKNIHERRIRDQPVVFTKDGVKYLRVLHVDPQGKSIEGLLRDNKVVSLSIDETGEENVYHFELELARQDQLMEFHFYNMKGKRIGTAMVDLEMFPVSRKEKKQGRLNGFFKLPRTMNPNEFGLVEATSSKRREGSNSNE